MRATESNWLGKSPKVRWDWGISQYCSCQCAQNDANEANEQMNQPRWSGQTDTEAVCVTWTTRNQAAVLNISSTDNLDTQWRFDSMCCPHPNHPLTLESYLGRFRKYMHLQGVMG